MGFAETGESRLKNNKKLRERRSGLSDAHLNTRTYKNSPKKGEEKPKQDFSMYRERRNKKRQKESQQRTIVLVIIFILTLFAIGLFLKLSILTEV